MKSRGLCPYIFSYNFIQWCKVLSCLVKIFLSSFFTKQLLLWNLFNLFFIFSFSLNLTKIYSCYHLIVNLCTLFYQRSTRYFLNKIISLEESHGVFVVSWWCSKAEILETTFSFRKFRAVPWRFRVPVMSGNHFVTKRFQKRKYPLFN